jgi:hypothetical protein
MKKTRRDLLKSAGVLGSLALPADLTATSEADAQGPSQTSRIPTTFQCVVTGRKESRKSVIVSHAPMQPITAALMPGYEFYRTWGEDSRPALPSDGSLMLEPHWFPKRDGFRFAITVSTSDFVQFDPVTFQSSETHN